MFMCGVSIEVYDVYQRLEELNHESSLSLRNWSGPPLVERRSVIKDQYQALTREITAREQTGSPNPGAGKKGKVKGDGQKGKGKGKFTNQTDKELRDERARVGKELDRITWSLQEGKFTSGEELVRPYRTLPMFVGVVLSGFGGEWITQGSCFICGNPHDTARCCRCQCGICQEHGLLLHKASQASGSQQWQGSSTACCTAGNGCNIRQKEILDFWRQQTREERQGGSSKDHTSFFFCFPNFARRNLII